MEKVTLLLEGLFQIVSHQSILCIFEMFFGLNLLTFFVLI